ncbi:MAG: rRNA pseudouridine synthase [Lachnospiraceae bacterium]|nr:rRNA pseudouridine synthase [Lachnospiraceae bacterium]
MRLDKYLSELNIGSRSQVKTYIRQKLIKVNGELATKPEQKVDETKDIITFRGNTLQYQRYVYYMLNKPQGVVSATQDNTAKTVVDIIDSPRKADLFPVGRLDKDTEGLLLLTNDGEMAHDMLSPKKHVNKTYLVTIKEKLSEEAINKLEIGVDIGDEKPTAPAMVQVQDDYHILLTIQEGRFHQVKRMLKAVDNEVTHLKRISFGALTLDEKLAPGESRELTPQEVELIHEETNATGQGSGYF